MKIIKILFIILLPFELLFLDFILWRLYYKFKGFKMPENISLYKKRGFLKRVFYDFPKQFWLDKFKREPGEFMEYGVHLFCGEQGSGKTTAVVDLLMNKWSKMYPKMKIYTNMDYLYQDGEINHWKDLINNSNGVFGVANVIDEIQNWFNSLQSKDFPPEMMLEITQQRKQRKVILGTAQVFGRIAKPIREQTSFVYLPRTFLGCFTIVRVSKPIYYDEATFEFKKYIKTYFFVHTSKHRKAFDTYKKIERYKEIGFKEEVNNINKLYEN